VATAELAPELQAFVQHLAVERRLAARTLALYTQALQRLQASAAATGVALMAAQPHHIRGWLVQLRTRGLAPRSIAIALAAWRGLYAWWGRNGRVTINPVLGVRPPKAARPCPRPCRWNRRWRWPHSRMPPATRCWTPATTPSPNCSTAPACAWPN
jgi:integrase/recombinase XerC